jgi:hypothetical protein
MGEVESQNVKQSAGWDSKVVASVKWLSSTDVKLQLSNCDSQLLKETGVTGLQRTPCISKGHFQQAKHFIYRE